MAEKDPMLNPDMNRYYYRPGTTEPELRPEFAAEESGKQAAAQAATAKASSGEEKKGRLPEDFPHYEQLKAAGITSYGKLRDLKGDYSSIEGIGEARAKEIDEALA